MLQAGVLLGEGASVDATARKVGYRSPSALTAMMRRQAERQQLTDTR
jgi:AraC-like DNA-binding protein